MRNIKILGLSLLLLSVFSCQQMEIVDDPHSEGRHELNIRGVIDQEYVTRANDNGFATGDKMGVYIIDYNAGTPGAIDAPDRRASNMQYVFDA